MLLELRVQNLLLVEEAELVLDRGLNVITGETGAGKTMLARAMDLLLGGKPRRGIVRPGADHAYIEGVFEVPASLRDPATQAELGIPEHQIDLEHDEIVLARRVTAAGRSRAFLQGRSVSADVLAVVGGSMLSFFGQHEHRKLALASAQLDVLDAFCGAKQLECRADYERLWSRSVALNRQLSELRERAGVRERDLDLLEFEIAEIEQADPTSAELVELEAERTRLESVEGLRAGVGGALGVLDPEGEAPGANDLLAAAATDLTRATELDAQLSELAERLERLVLESRDLARDLAGYVSGLAADPQRLELLRERLDLLGRLQRKHGGSIEAVLEHAERCRAERERLANHADESARLEQELAQVESELRRLANVLGAARTKRAPELAREVRRELAQLALGGASFEVVIERKSNERTALGPKGAETVEFSLAPNSGVPAGPLREIASGGELSRVMLALMTVATRSAGSQAVVFDEVDAGVGGRTANAVGGKLRDLAAIRQVICITHLPQVASLAGRHFRVTKAAGGSAGDEKAEPIARARVEQLEKQDVIAELCRMLGSDAADSAARRHAERLLQAA